MSTRGARRSFARLTARERRGIFARIFGFGRGGARTQPAPSVAPARATPTPRLAQATSAPVRRAPQRGVARAEGSETPEEFAARMARLPTKSPAQLRQMARENDVRAEAIARWYREHFPERVARSLRDEYAKGVMVDVETGRMYSKPPDNAPPRALAAWWRAVAKYHPGASERERARTLATQYARAARANAQAARAGRE